VPGERLVRDERPGAARAGATAEPARQPRPLWPSAWLMPKPQAAAVAVVALLGFGVLVGSAVSPSASSSTGSLLVAHTPSAASTTQAAAAAPPPAEAASTPEPSSSEAASEPASASKPTRAAGAPKTKTPARGEGRAPAGSEGGAPAAENALPPVKHVFLIVLSEHGYKEAFGAGSPASYLAKTLVAQGELLSNYYAVTQGVLANEIALISGQGPTPQTAADCPTFTDITPGTVGAEEQVSGSGCVYPAETLTLANQLSSAGKTWKAYVEDVGSGVPGEATSCRHPVIGASNPAQEARPGDTYVTWRNPFVYFHSLIDGAACTDDDVGLNELAGDLKSAHTTPSLAYIVPDRCHDGSEQPCSPGAPAGLAAADAFLRTLVPEIERSAAYKEGGMIAITFDQAPQSGPDADPSACCETPQYPNLMAATAPSGATGETGASGTTSSQGATGTTAPTTTTPGALSGGEVSATGGGGRVGLLLISAYVKAGSVDELGYYNHFSLLRSIEELFHLKRLGYTANPALPVFDKLVYNASRRHG
jgi:phosphatidylinositol-3-phosphatase